MNGYQVEPKMTYLRVIDHTCHWHHVAFRGSLSLTRPWLSSSRWCWYRYRYSVRGVAWWPNWKKRSLKGYTVLRSEGPCPNVYCYWGFKFREYCMVLYLYLVYNRMWGIAEVTAAAVSALAWLRWLPWALPSGVPSCGTHQLEPGSFLLWCQTSWVW